MARLGGPFAYLDSDFLWQFSETGPSEWPKNLARFAKLNFPQHFGKRVRAGIIQIWWGLLSCDHQAVIHNAHLNARSR
ncbi:hypothetical protein FHW67_003392 [Herbaspirillum sp. Sphag1AN]|nr:hypothetical protein [Herbaspirillum sp. Sphag1AN]MBB3247525.1 hypothetical protein [Herbaspirillum sp. Sphag64]